MSKKVPAYQLGSADPYVYTTFSGVDCKVIVTQEDRSFTIPEVQKISWRIKSNGQVEGKIELILLNGQSNWGLFRHADSIQIKAANEYGHLSSICFDSVNCELVGEVNVDDICIIETIEFTGTNNTSWTKPT